MREGRGGARGAARAHVPGVQAQALDWQRLQQGGGAGGPATKSLAYLRCRLARGTPATLPSPMKRTQNSMTDTWACDRWRGRVGSEATPSADMPAPHHYTATTGGGTGISVRLRAPALGAYLCRRLLHGVQRAVERRQQRVGVELQRARLKRRLGRAACRLLGRAELEEQERHQLVEQRLGGAGRGAQRRLHGAQRRQRDLRRRGRGQIGAY